MAPPLEAMVLALGRLCVGAAWPAPDGIRRASQLRLPKSKKLVSTPFLSRNALTLTSCDLIVLLNTVVCCAMVAPPRKTMPDSMPASTRQTMVSRSECGSLTTRPSMLVIAVSATPSSMPAKIRNRVAAKVQVNSNSAANSTTPMPPTDIAHARSLRARRRSSAGPVTLIPSRRIFRRQSFAKTRPGSSGAAGTRRFDAGVSGVPSGAGRTWRALRRG